MPIKQLDIQRTTWVTEGQGVKVGDRELGKICNFYAPGSQVLGRGTSWGRIWDSRYLWTICINGVP